MATLYRVSFKAASEKKLGDWFQAQGLNAAMDRVKSRLQRQDGPYRQRDRGEEFGPRKPFQEAVKSFSDALKQNEVGDIRMIIPDSPKGAVTAVRKVHVVDVNYPTISGNATPNAKALVKPLWNEFPQLQYWGCYNCRRIANSSSWSEHAWADALDVHPPTMLYGDQANRWLNANRGRLNITRVLWREWNHYDHLHIDLDPDHSGYPPCA